ncbi:hypothetical protein C4J81_00690 [Deltaproteobacteria bacterium Smac51]|nr:hypothetical protein C4J81_00690 [Deltaproteobacteria bacterium Smac51]
MSNTMAPQPERPAFEEWAQARLAEINEPPEGQGWHLVFDPLAGPDLLAEAGRADSSAKFWPLYLNTYIEEALASGPHMVRLEPHSPLSGWALSKMRDMALGLLFLAETDKFEALYEHLQNFFECRLPGGRRAFFRYYDPRQFYGFTTYGDPDQGLLLLGPALKALGWEPGREITMELSQPRDRGFRCPPGGLGVGDAFSDHLFRECRIHTVIGGIINQVGEHYKARLAAKPLPEAYAMVQRLADQLAEYPLNNNNLALATFITIDKGQSFWRRPEVREALRNSGPGLDGFKKTLVELHQA